MSDDDGRLWAASKNLPRVNLCGCTIEQGDVIEVWLSMRGMPERYQFWGFNPHLFTLHLIDLDSGEPILIPYKSIKKMRVVAKAKNKNKGRGKKKGDEG
jgi:hypothetical protein